MLGYPDVMAKTLPILAAALCVGACSASNPEQDAVMKAIEAQVSLPAGAAPLRDYVRYYAWEQDRRTADAKVAAAYLLHDGVPGRRWVTREELPLQIDGGCSFVSLTYTLSENRIERVECNTSLNPDFQADATGPRERPFPTPGSEAPAGE